MALTHCPECGYQLSDKAYQCPKCAYPMNVSFNHQKDNNQKNNTSQIIQQPLTADYIQTITDKKNMTTAVLLTIFFGILGLFYVDYKKALKLLFVGIVVEVLIILTFGNSAFITLIITAIILWIVSIITAINGVNEYNNNLSIRISKINNYSSSS